MVVRGAAGTWDITNLGTVLFARNLDQFKGLGRKVIRVVFYEGKGRLKALREQAGRKGYAHKALNAMDRADRVRACYLYACLRFVQRDPMTNSSLRERFGIGAKNAATASRIIRDAIADSLIRPYDPDQGKKYAKYVPFWA